MKNGYNVNIKLSEAFGAKARKIQARGNDIYIPRPYRNLFVSEGKDALSLQRKIDTRKGGPHVFKIPFRVKPCLAYFLDKKLHTLTEI